MAALDYSKYPLRPHQIRLVSLAPPSTDGSQRKWRLEVCSLTDENTRYYAVSYRWGAPLLEGHFADMSNETESPVQFETGVVKVTQNLASLLASLLTEVEASSPTGQSGGEYANGGGPAGGSTEVEALDPVKSLGHVNDPSLDLSSAKIWVDAVCINQEDLDERSHQISTMTAKIYESAESVITWLGDSDAHTEQAFAHLDALAKGSAYISGAVADIVNSREHWESTAKLFERTYWNRAWIIQEVALAKQVIVRCGKYSTSWSVLSKASHIISTGTWREYFESRHEKLRLQTFRQPRSGGYKIPTVLKAVKDSMACDHWATILLHSLIRSRDFEATKEEDKVYALLGLIQDSVDVGKMPLLYPEFGDIGRTYLKTATQLLRDCEDLLVLASVEGKSFQAAELALPSWVPDWSCRLPLGLRVTGLKRYSADACFIPPDTFLSREEKLTRWPVDVNEGENTVTLKAFKVDEISYHGEPKDDIWKGIPFPRLPSMLLSLPPQYPITEEPGLEALWRTLIANTAGSERVAPPKPSFMGPGFVKWFRERVNSAVTSPPQKGARWNELKRQFSEFCKDNKEWYNLYAASDAAPTPAISGSATAEYASSFSHGRFLRPFLTQKGYLGLGSQDLREGDTVWMVPRSRVPLIFRRVQDVDTAGDYHCELAGAAYLHGFMDGRALSLMAATECVKLRDMLETVVIH